MNLLHKLSGFPRDFLASVREFLGLLLQVARAPDGKLLSLLLSLAWPVVLARSSQSVIGFCDALMIAPLGESALAATTTGAINAFFIVILPMGIAFIVQSFASQFHGQNDLLGAKRYAWYGLILAGLFAALGLALLPLVGWGLSAFPYTPEVHALMTEYLVIRLLSVGAIVGIEVLGNWYGGLGNTRLHMISSLLTMVLNVALNWLLIEGNLGFPALGVSGAALASVIASWAGFALLAVLFATNYGIEPTRGKLSLCRSEFFRMLRFGAPNGVNWFLEFGAFFLFINLVVSHLGPVVQAAMMVVIQINSVSFMPAFGGSSSGAILVGQAIGRKERDQVAKIVAHTAACTTLWQVSVGIVYVAVPYLLITPFMPPTAASQEFLEVGASMLAISAAWQLFDASAMALSEALRAAGDTAWCMWARLTLAWVIFTPGSVITVRVLGGGPNVAVLCFVVYLALLAFALIWRFHTGAWRNIDLTGAGH